MIEIRVSSDEYQIKLPYSQKDRAKNIPSYRWDPVQKIWRYPRRAYVLQSIESEFGPEEVVWREDDRSRDQDSGKTEMTVSWQTSEVIELREDLIKAKEDLIKSNEALIERNQNWLELFDLAERHGFKEDGDLGELFEFTKAAYEANDETSDLIAKYSATKAQLNAVLAENNELKARMGSSSPESFKEVLLRVATGIEDQQSSLARLFPEFQLDKTGPIALQNILQKLLEEKLGRKGERVTFANLIGEASDAQLLSKNAISLCHTIRIQRNLFAHEDVPGMEVMARSAMCLMAFVIVYRELLASV